MSAALTPQLWEESLFKLGFARAEDGYRRNGTLLKTQGRWSSIELSAPPPGDPLRDQLGKPGLWKWVNDGARPRCVFELPTDVLVNAEDDDSPDQAADTPLARCVAWAQAAAESRVPAWWRPPARHLIDAWVPQKRLTVQSGAQVCQGELICTPTRLALRFPVVSALPADLPQVRAYWLGEVLRDAQNRWRMVRLGIAAEGESSLVIAEVDFTGAPPGASEHLILAGLDGLRWVVTWLVESVGFLCDVSQASQALELCAVHEPNQNRKEQT